MSKPQKKTRTRGILLSLFLLALIAALIYHGDIQTDFHFNFDVNIETPGEITHQASQDEWTFECLDISSEEILRQKKMLYLRVYDHDKPADDPDGVRKAGFTRSEEAFGHQRFEPASHRMENADHFWKLGLDNQAPEFMLKPDGAGFYYPSLDDQAPEFMLKPDGAGFYYPSGREADSTPESKMACINIAEKFRQVHFVRAHKTMEEFVERLHSIPDKQTFSVWECYAERSNIPVLTATRYVSTLAKTIASIQFGETYSPALYGTEGLDHLWRYAFDKDQPRGQVVISLDNTARTYLGNRLLGKDQKTPAEPEYVLECEQTLKPGITEAEQSHPSE